MRNPIRPLLAAALLTAATTAAVSANGITVPSGKLGGNCGIGNENSARFSNYCGARVSLTGGDLTDTYVQDSSPTGVVTYRARMYVNLRGLSMVNGDSFELFSAYSNGGSDPAPPATAGVAAFRVVVDQAGGDKRVTLFARDGGGEDQTVPVPLRSGWRSIEVSWSRDSGSGGSLSWWLNGAAQAGLGGLNNGTLAIDYARWGAVDISGGSIAGSFHLDDFASQLSGALGAAAVFSDNPTSSPFFPFIQGIYAAEVIPGTGINTFSPAGLITRKEMAQFVLKARYGSSFAPPACTPPGSFADVPCGAGAAGHAYDDWIYEFVRQGITAGCGGGNYCPEGTVNRGEMAVFLVVAAGFATSPCPPSSFGDVASNSPFCPFIKEIAEQGITAGCGGGNFCPNSTVSRSQMSVFMMTTFTAHNPELQQHLP